MSVEKYIITKEDTHFSIIPNKVAQNLRDAEALGLWIYLQSLPPSWEFYKEKIREHFGWGRDKLDKKLGVLKEHNLAEPTPMRDEKGKFVEWTLYVKNGRDFVITHNTENPCSGDLSTGGSAKTGDLNNKCTHNTENPAAGKPVTGFDTAINTTKTKEKDFIKKSFCAVAPKKSKSDWKKENTTAHSFAEAMNNAAQSKKQMERETKHIEESQNFKRAEMPESLRSLVQTMKVNHA